MGVAQYTSHVGACGADRLCSGEERERERESEERRESETKNYLILFQQWPTLLTWVALHVVGAEAAY